MSNTDKWDAIDKAIEIVLPKSTKKENTSINPFEKFQSKDEKVKVITNKDGMVMRLIEGQNYPVYESIEQVNDYFIYTFSCRQNKILTRLPSVPNGIAINKAFFDTFSDKDKFIVEIIPSKGRNILARYRIQKSIALKEGKIKQFPGYEKQIAISLNFWEKIS